MAYKSIFDTQQPTKTIIGYQSIFGNKPPIPILDIQKLPDELRKEQRREQTKQITDEMIKSGQATTTPIGSIPPREKPSLLSRAVKKIGEYILSQPNKVRTVDIIREIPEAITTIGKFAKTIQEEISRSGASVGLTLAGALKGGAKELDISGEEIENKVARVIFGTKPLKSIESRIADAELAVKDFGQKLEKSPSEFKKSIGKFSEENALGLSILGVGGTITLDFTGAGGQKSAIKAIAQSKDIGFISKVLRQINVAEDLIPATAKKLAGITDEKVILTAINKIGEIQKSTKMLKEGIDEGIKIQKVAGGFNWTERGFIKSIKGELPELKVSGQYIPRSTDRLAMKAKTLIKEDFATAEKMAITGTDDASVATGAELLKHYSDEAVKTTDDIIKNALYDKAAKLGNIMARNLTEQGRSIQAASILGRLTPEGQIRFAAREIQKYNEEIVKKSGGILGLQKKIPELTSEQVKQITDEMKAIKEMAEGTEKAMRFQKLQNYISDLVPTPLFKKIIAVWKAGLLTGLKTSGLNIFANISHAGTEIVKDIPAVIIDKIISLFSGVRTKTFTLKGIIGGSKEGMGKGLRYLKTGFDERNIGTKLDYRRIKFGEGKLARGLQAYTDAIFRILGMEDQPFYYAAKLRSLYEQAKVGAINKGLKGEEAQKFIDDLIQNPTEQMIKYASVDAETAVFQNPTILGQAARSIQKIGGGAGEIIVPFGRTPSAVAMQILNYSPVGIAKTIFENIGKGRFDQRLFSQGISRGLTGTAMLALGVLLYKKGMITTARPTGEKEQKLWELEGRQPNSIKIGNKWRQVQILGPIGNVLLIGGSFQKAFYNSGSLSEAIAIGLADASKSFTQQTFLTGISNFIDAVSDPSRSAKSVVGSTLASTIPTIIADIARATDTVERRANEIFEKFQARIPGIREILEPQITTLGEKKGTMGNPLEIMIDPSRPSPIKKTPVINELRRLWDLGFKVSPTLLGDKAGYKELTDQQNTELWKKAGEIINEKLNNLIQKEEYQKLPDDGKGKIIEDIIDKSKLVARVSILIELTQGLQGEELKVKLSELKKSDFLTRDVFNNYLKLR